ncbi:polysaccharide deacetylase family protein [Nocardioides daejeonensis]|uniref:polysaccharide deacetylase family protein n=1 Tax=Nocardioides daejeonensis TaxID=1046556 RepID=UPI000D74DE75|nr:polysaccharide deacetylase family protein [Nocardioides daejeonensis]
MPTAVPSRGRVLSVLLCAVLVLSGCNFGGADDSGAPDASPSAQQSKGAGESSAGQEIRTRTLTSFAPRYHATWPVVPGADALNQELADEVTRQVDAFTAEVEPGGTAAPELNIGWRLVAQSDQVVAVRLDTYEFAGASGAESSRTWWFDPATGRVLDNRELIADPEALGIALAASVEDPDADRSRIRRAAEEGLDDLEFTSTGALRVRFDEYAVAPGSSGEVVVTLDTARTELVLSDFGRLASAAASSLATDDESQGLVTPAPPEETPEPVETETPLKPEASGSTPPEPREVNCRKAKCVALTFDDGPVSDTTRLLRTLRRLDVPATFFVLGQQAATYPELVAKTARAGHEIGIHTWDHKQLTSLKPPAIRQEMRSAAREVRRITGRAPTLVRPPYGATDARVQRIARELGLAQVLWSVDTLDWKRKAAKPVIAEVKKSTRRGSIILMHDIHRTSVDAVPGVVKALQAKGYTLVTVSQLLGKTKPGQKYYSGAR